MSDAAIPAGAGSPKLDPETLVLRANPRPVTRFKRKVVIAALGGTALAVLAAAWMALGIIRPDAPLIQKTLNELTDITRRGAELDVEFWSALLGDLNAQGT